METPQRLYPIGEQFFQNIRERNLVYIDKTELIYNLTHGSTNYVFLSRPRRFGKSLLLYTMRDYFMGKRELFNGLAIEKLETKWTEHPVFVATFSMKKYFDVSMLNNRFEVMISKWEEKYGKDDDEHDYAERFAGVVQRAVQQTGHKAVVLIDEYDSPLLDSNDNPELQKQLRNIMRGFFSPLKELTESLRFLFITGITKFSQLSIFSELNNLENISMSDKYSAICGISKEELLTQMKVDIELLAEANNETFDEACEHLREKYDGYHFSKNSSDVYNPFSLVRAFYNKEYGSYWFESGTPTFLIELLRKTMFDINKMEETYATEAQFNRPAESITNPIPILYQSGYLTIKGYDPATKYFRLAYPNNEVRYGFLESLIPNYVRSDSPDSEFVISNFYEDLTNCDMERCLTRLKAFFAQIPYDLDNKTERHYQTIFYLIFTLLGQNIRVEYRTASGRIDSVVWLPQGIFVFEFKFDGNADEALEQINSKGYAIPFSADGRKIFKVGVNFDKEARTFADWKIEEE